MKYHQPVLKKELVDLLAPQSGKIYIDATVGLGGHTIEILKKAGIVYGIDADSQNLTTVTDRIKKLGLKNFHPIHANFTKLKTIIKKHIKNTSNISGLILDLGLSSNQQTAQNRGFSFNDNQSLDMRLDPHSQTTTAEFIINTYEYPKLFAIFATYAQEKYAKPISLKIIQERRRSPIKTATRLANIVRNYYKSRRIKTRIDPSTKIFLALRIVVNNELNNLKNILSQSLICLPPQTTVCIISFHSGEDRIVKHFIRSHPQKITSLTTKPIRPKIEEIRANPLSRSACLRAFKIKILS